MAITKMPEPMRSGKAALFFGIPALIFLISIYILLPQLGRVGVHPIINYTLTLTGPVVLLFAASFAALKIDGYKLNRRTIRLRFRLFRLSKREWIWTVGLTLFMVAGNFLLFPTQEWLLDNLNLSLPDYLPSTLDPRVTVQGIPPEFETTPLAWLILFQLLFLFFNIFGEEFWWRGYILPRQEIVYGHYTWVVHGVLWTLFHVFWWWTLIYILPGALAASYVAQRFKNTTMIIIAHLLVNTVGGTLIMLLNG